MDQPDSNWVENTEQCIRCNINLAWSVIHGKTGNPPRNYASWARDIGVEQDDIESVARDALQQACERFDQERGARFSTFAVRVIENALLSYLQVQESMVSMESRQTRKARQDLIELQGRLQSALGREPSLEEIALESRVPLFEVEDLLKTKPRTVSWEQLGQSEEDARVLDETVAGSDLDEQIEERETQAAFQQGLKYLYTYVQSARCLSNDEKNVLLLRWGLDPNSDRKGTPLTRREVARTLADGNAESPFVAKAGKRLDYLTEKVRAIELEALVKLEKDIVNTKHNRR